MTSVFDEVVQYALWQGNTEGPMCSSVGGGGAEKESSFGVAVVGMTANL